MIILWNEVDLVLLMMLVESTVLHFSPKSRADVPHVNISSINDTVKRSGYHHCQGSHIQTSVCMICPFHFSGRPSDGKGDTFGNTE